MMTAHRMLVALFLGQLLVLSACGQEPQASEGEGWRWLATTAARDEAFLWHIDDLDALRAFWHEGEAGDPAPDTALPEVDFDDEFVLVLSTRGRGTRPAPCGVYFRGLRADQGERSLTVVFEQDTSQEVCTLAYNYGQYVVAVDRSFAGEPPFEIFIHEPGQAGQPAPVPVTK